MAVPINISPATAIVLTPPSNITLDVFDTATSYTVWYRYTAVEGDYILGLNASGLVGGYQPKVRIYSPDGTTETNFFNHTNQPFFFHVTPGVEYFFEIRQITGNFNPSNLTFTVEKFTRTAIIPAGSVFINEANYNNTGLPTPGSWAVPGTLKTMGVFVGSPSGNILNIVQNFVPGEHGTILDNGRMCVEDNLGNGGNNLISDQKIRVNIYNSNLSLLFQFEDETPEDGWEQSPISSNNIDKFYIGRKSDFDILTGTGDNSALKIVSDTGTILEDWVAVGEAGMICLCPNNAETVLYWAINQEGEAVQVWDLVNGVSLGNFATAVAGKFAKDIVVLENNNVAILYRQDDTVITDIIVRVYNSAGTLLDTFSYGNGIEPRICKDLTHEHFWIFIKGENGGSRDGTVVLDHINSDTGAIITSLPNVFCFPGGAYNGPNVLPAPTQYGVPDSCPVFITTVPINISDIVEAGGIYQIVPGKTDDTIYTNFSPLETEDVPIP